MQRKRRLRGPVHAHGARAPLSATAHSAARGHTRVVRPPSHYSQGKDVCHCHANPAAVAPPAAPSMGHHPDRRVLEAGITEGLQPQANRVRKGPQWPRRAPSDLSPKSSLASSCVSSFRASPSSCARARARARTRTRRHSHARSGPEQHRVLSSCT